MAIKTTRLTRSDKKWGNLFSPTYGLLLIVLCTVLPVFFSSGQQNNGILPTRISTLSQKHGLSSSKITSICKDDFGFIWFGTTNGLNRYDGKSIKSYQYDPQNKESLSSDYIKCLYKDSNGSLWIGTAQGLNLFDYETQTFIKHHNANTEKHLSITAITEDKDNNLWVISSRGLSRRVAKTGLFETYQEIYQKAEFTTSIITKIHCDKSGKLWVGTWTDGIYLVDTKTGVAEKFSTGNDLEKIISAGHVSALAESPEGSIWVGGWDFGLMHISPDRQTVTTYKHDNQNENSLNSNKIKSLAFDSSGFLWIGTEESGLDRFSPEEKTFVHYFADFHGSAIYEGASIYSILIDDESVMWLGFRNDGVKKVPLHTAPFQHFSRAGEENYRVFSLTEGKEGLWLGVRGALDHLDLKTGYFTRYPLPNNETPISIYELAPGRLLTGTYKGSVFLFDIHSRSFKEYLPESIQPIFADEKINCFHKTSKYELLIGSQAGLFNYNIKNTTLKKLSHKWIHTILPTTSDSYCLLRFDEAFYLYYPATGELITNKFKGIGPLKSGAFSAESLFLGTDLGFYEYKLKHDSIFQHKDVFPYRSIQVNAMLKDKQQNIWFSSENDLVFFDRNRNTFRTFNTLDGLPAMRFRDETGILLKNGNIVFGGDGGIILVNPAVYQARENKANLKFSKLLIANREILVEGNNSPLKKDISLTNSLTLKYHQNIISFEFGLLSYINPRKHQYRYKMSGMDDQWFDLADRNSITFANLPPGDYKLYIQASNEDGVWGKTESIGITVLPPFWKTWYAYSFYLLCLVVISYLIRKVNLNKEKLKNKIAMERMKQENIRKLAKQESEFHDMRLRFFTNISHEFRTPLTLILGPLKKFIQKNEQPTGAHLTLMYKNAERLKRLITQILDFRKMEAGDLKFEPTWGDIVRFSLETANLFMPLAQEKSIQFRTYCNEQSKQAWFDKDKLEKIIFNLLSNAFKFTTHGSVSFTVNLIENKNTEINTLYTDEKTNQDPHISIEIIVADTGVGIPEAEQSQIFDRFYHVQSEKSGQSSGTGIGLTLTKELVEVHQGAICVKSKVQKGSEFRVVIPLLTEEKVPDQLEKASPSNESAGLSDQATTETLLSQDQESMVSGSSVRPVVLLVENNKDLRRYLRLEFGGSYTLIEAENGKEGLDKALQHIPDLIISDIMMPEMDGIEFCNFVKTEKLTSHIPIILLTAHSSQIHMKEGLETGADDFITKPFSSDLLITRMSNLLKSRRELQSKYSRELRLNPEGLPVASMDEAFLRKAMEAVEANLNNADFNADLFASEMCISRVHLYRKLKALTDLSITDFVKNARLKLALNLIKDNKLTIKETAYAVGFKDPKYFSKCFKEEFGVRPSEYHKRSVIDGD